MTNTAVPAAQLRDLLSDAIDEIYALRCAAAFEAALIQGHLTYKTFPKSRRRFGEDQVERLFELSRGRVAHAYAGTSTLSLDGSLARAGGKRLYFAADWADSKLPTRLPLNSRPLADGEEEMLREDLGRAVREIDETRRAFSYEGAVVVVHTHQSSFPKTPAKIIEEQAERMLAAACGDVALAYDKWPTSAAMRASGASSTLTNEGWKAEQPARRLR